MSLLERIIQIDGAEETIAALIDRYTGHMCWSVSDLVRTDKRVPSNERLIQIARLLQFAAPTTLGIDGAWLDLLDVLAKNGLSAGERLDLLIEVLRSDIPGGQLPGPGLLAHAAAQLSADELRPIVANLDANPVRNNTLFTLVCAAPLLEAGDEPPAALDEAFVFYATPPVCERILRALTAERREQVLLRVMQTERKGQAQFILEAISFFLDLIDSPALEAAMQKLREVAAPCTDIDELYALLDAGGVTLDADGLNPFVQESLDWWFDLQAEVRKEAGVGAMAEHEATVRLGVPDAAELASVEAWAAASDERREAIAKAVLELIGKKRFKLVGIQTYADLPIAVFQHRRKKTKFSLLPGGAFVRGLSETEEAKLRERAEAAGLTGIHEEFGQLIDQLPAMRPVQKVTVGPMLFGQGTGFELEPAKLSGWISRGPWRLPTEAEWEYAARGGQAGQLTYRGDELPLQDWFEQTGKLGDESANRFGLWDFGFEPEICADCFKPSYEGAPTDGSPVTGEGPRVVRGGAGQVYPWQGCGEWHLMLSAMRGDQAGWEYVVFARPVIGLGV